MLFLKVLHYIAECGFIRKCSESSRAESFSLSEKHLCKSVGISLYVTGKVEVDIGRFVSVESEKRLERNIMSVTDHFRAALGAVFLGQVKAGADFALYKEFAVTAFRAAVMWGKRIDLCYSRHCRGKGRAYRTARANLISRGLAVLNELSRDDVHYRKAVFDY